VSGLGGFMRGGGEQALDIKRWLLRHEGVAIS
jgi:O6-methylguanine-DNA--protein-cysteine methyltransferase